jgi:crossover junction endodeoxyribonuclease RuvC
MIVMGIDPGINGGLTLLNDGRIDGVWVMPTIEKGLDAKTIRNILVDIDFVVMEKVSAMPKQGVVSMFHFGVGYGMLQGIIITLGIPLRLITPQAWKKEILAGTTKDKAASIEYVKRVYPYLDVIPAGYRKPHDGICDSVCIAEFGFRVYGR